LEAFSGLLTIRLRELEATFDFLTLHCGSPCHEQAHSRFWGLTVGR